MSNGVFENGLSSKSAVMGFGFITITRDWQLFVVFVKETLSLTFFFLVLCFCPRDSLGYHSFFSSSFGSNTLLLFFVTVEIKKRKTLEYAFALPCCVKKKKAEGTSSWFKT